MTYESILERESQTTPGVTFVLAKMSFGRRVELTRRLREIAQRVEFLEAGDVREKIGCEYVVKVVWVDTEPYLAVGSHRYTEP